MAKRKQEPGSAQETASQPPVTAPATDSTRAGIYRRKTFLITDELEARLLRLAEQEQVGQNELVRYLLTWALEQVEQGRHQLPATPVARRTLGI